MTADQSQEGPADIEPNLVLPDDVFDELAAALETPPGPMRLEGDMIVKPWRLQGPAR
jgi:hypothetical protein